MTELNDVSEYLNELIPYRCPKCGHLRRFATLRELRQHLQVEHSFQMGFIKPHSRACVFKRSNNGDSPRQNHRNAFDNDISTRKDNRMANQVVDFRESSPLLNSFKTETELLEKELQRAIQIEMKHKTASMQNLATNSINTECHTTLNTILNDKPYNQTGVTKPSLKSEQPNHQLFVEKTKPSIFPQFDQTTITSLSHLNPDVHQLHFNQWITRDSLSKSQEILHEMENNVENKCQQQRDTIQQLIHDMKIKDEQMELNRKRHSDLKNEREKLLREQEALMQESDDFNSKLKHDLNHKHSELDTLNEDMERLKKLSEHQLQLKSKDLQQATERANRLEQERDILLQETQRILKHADSDNERLKKQLEKKELELRKVNDDLRRLRSQQEDMLEKTVDIYNSCEDSKEIMHTAINTKDQQLQQAKQQIENMANMQRRLVEQSRVLTDQADDNTENMKHLLQTKAKQMEQLTTQLETLKSEKRNLENNTACLSEQSESSRFAVESLQQLVKQRENDLKTTQSELQQLKTFLKSAADKERIARQKLEVFIEDLIHRAERAESELRSLKSQSSDTMNKVDPLYTDSHNDIQADDSTHRNSLPSRLESVHQNQVGEPDTLFMPETFGGDFVDTILRKGLNKQTIDARGKVIAETNENIDIHLSQRDKLLSRKEIVDNPMTDLHDHNDKQTHRTDFKQTDGSNKRRNIIQYKINDDKTKVHYPDYINNLNDRWKYDRTTSPTDVGESYDANIEEYDGFLDPGEERATSYRKQTEKPKRIDRDVQVRTYLSKHSEYDNVSEDDITDDCEYDERNYVHQSNQSNLYKQMGSKRPATIGKSHQNIDAMKKKSSIKKKTALNDGFDTNLPEVHRSMIDIPRDSRSLSEGEVRLRDRRSRSLSPRTMEQRKFYVDDHNGTRVDVHNYMKRDIDTRDELDEETEYSVDESVIEGLSRDIVDGEQSKETDGVFHNIMDDNGILWDDDNATLPDVSDSELDRVSPSGSEAKSSHRKSTPSVASVNNYKTNSRNDSRVIHRSNNNRPDKRQELVISPSTSSVVCLLNNNSTQGHSESASVLRKTYPNRLSSVNRISKKTHEYKLADRKERKETISKSLFKPISSSPDNKSSISDKDMTSGGREVHSYMRNSPNTPKHEYLTHMFSPTKTRSSTDASQSRSVDSISKDYLFDNIKHDVNTTRRKTETAKETIDRISQKYSPKRTKQTTESKSSSSIADKISSISEKYKLRRQHVLEGKGVETIGEPGKPTLQASPRTACRRFIGSKSDSNINSSHMNPTHPSAVASSEQNGVSAPMLTPYGYMPYPPYASNSGSPQPLPFVHFPNMQQYAGFMGMPYGPYGHLPNMAGNIQRPEHLDINQSISTDVIKSNTEDNSQLLHANESIPVSERDVTASNSMRNAENAKVSKVLPLAESEISKSEIQRQNTENGAVLSFNIPGASETQHYEADNNANDIATNDNKHSNEPVSVSESLQFPSFNDSITGQSPIGNQITGQMAMTDQIAKETDDHRVANPTSPAIQDYDLVTNGRGFNSIDNSPVGEVECFSTDVSEPSSPHLKLFNDVDTIDSDVELSKFSMFAETIEDDHTSIGCDTNSFLDLPGTLTESELDGDTDTESVRRNFYEKSQHVKDLVEASSKVRNDITSHRKAAMSSASSQASIEIDERIPQHKREQVKRRRSALVCIFSFLDTRMITVVARVCREWRIVSRSPKLWRRVVLRDDKVSSKFLRRISRRCGQLGVLILENLHPRTRFETETVEEYQTNIRCSLEDGYEQILKKAEATIHTIEVINCGTVLSAKCLWVASCCCRMLKHVTYLSNFDPINAEVMWALGSGCRELKSLRCQPLYPCTRETNFTTRCAQMIGQCFKDLQLLSLGGITVDITSLIYIGKQCQKLSTIQLHRMQFITCEVIDEMCQNGLQHLKCLCLYTTPIAPGALTILHAYCKYLDRVIISLTEADFLSCKKTQKDDTLPDYNEIYDGYEVLKKQPQFIKTIILDIEAPSKHKKKETTEETEKETSFFDRWFK